MPEQRRLIPDAAVAERYGVSLMTLWRWDRDETLNFPKPRWIRRRKYRDAAELDVFDEERAAADAPEIVPPTKAKAEAEAA